MSSITIVANIILVPETFGMILHNYLLAHLAILYLVIVLVFKTTDFQRGLFGNTNSIGISDVSLVNFFSFLYKRTCQNTLKSDGWQGLILCLLVSGHSQIRFYL